MGVDGMASHGQPRNRTAENNRNRVGTVGTTYRSGKRKCRIHATDREHVQQGAVAERQGSRLEICSGGPIDRLEIC